MHFAVRGLLRLAADISVSCRHWLQLWDQEVHCDAQGLPPLTAVISREVQCG